jgi:hypothetical protein
MPRGAVVVLGTLLLACQSDEAVLTVTLEPSPLHAELVYRSNRSAGGVYRMSWRLVIREHGGSDAEIRSIRCRARETRSMVILVDEALEAPAIIARVGTNRVPANGVLVVPLDTTFGYETLRIAPAQMTTVVEAADARHGSRPTTAAVTAVQLDE